MTKDSDAMCSYIIVSVLYYCYSVGFVSNDICYIFTHAQWICVCHLDYVKIYYVVKL